MFVAGGGWNSQVINMDEFVNQFGFQSLIMQRHYSWEKLLRKYYYAFE